MDGTGLQWGPERFGYSKLLNNKLINFQSSDPSATDGQSIHTRSPLI